MKGKQMILCCCNLLGGYQKASILLANRKLPRGWRQFVKGWGPRNQELPEPGCFTKWPLLYSPQVWQAWSSILVLNVSQQFTGYLLIKRKVYLGNWGVKQERAWWTEWFWPGHHRQAISRNRRSPNMQATTGQHSRENTKGVERCSQCDHK